ncbi:hypothetical protein DPMN_194435 [Dreissena polymorpha]|uniref:Uncharacterized protein n=1 Tax=Dreissena polymorpha TaxID=45954 RepID=A0A9D3Y3N7_DREPO|nr:hypothetical protein DPMN_194435 [Dreissena polymorpha]
MHWSVVAILANLVALLLSTTAETSHHWTTQDALERGGNTGLPRCPPPLYHSCDVTSLGHTRCTGAWWQYWLTSLPSSSLPQL